MENTHIMTHTIMQEAIEATKAMVQTLMEAARPTKRSSFVDLFHFITLNGPCTLSMMSQLLSLNLFDLIVDLVWCTPHLDSRLNGG